MKKIIYFFLLIGISMIFISSIVWYGQEKSLNKLRHSERLSTQTINRSNSLTNSAVKELELRNDIVREQIKKGQAQKNAVPFIFVGTGITILSIVLLIVSPSNKN